ncbi:MAG: hypothetical protein Q8P45_02345 [Candidatus Harrisonbacteria bacterium]|nr:hypothetical protein [Candidatus Harrisonbacteria bacterium]
MSKKLILSLLTLVMVFGVLAFAAPERTEAATYTSSVYGSSFYWDRPYGGFPYARTGGWGGWGYPGNYSWGWSEGPASVRHFDSQSGNVTHACYGQWSYRQCF